MRFTLANQREAKPFANVQSVRSLRKEHGSKPFEERKHLFPYDVDVGYFRQIDDQPHFGVAACHERANVLCPLASESAFESKDECIN